jgi:hypothetical protein
MIDDPIVLTLLYLCGVGLFVITNIHIDTDTGKILAAIKALEASLTSLKAEIAKCKEP